MPVVLLNQDIAVSCGSSRTKCRSRQRTRVGLGVTDRSGSVRMGTSSGLTMSNEWHLQKLDDGKEVVRSRRHLARESDVGGERVGDQPDRVPVRTACATVPVPTMVLPPARLSTITGCRNDCESWSATARATTSVPPPAGYGTIHRIGRSGEACASAPVQAVTYQ